MWLSRRGALHRLTLLAGEKINEPKFQVIRWDDNLADGHGSESGESFGATVDAGDHGSRTVWLVRELQFSVSKRMDSRIFSDSTKWVAVNSCDF
jgi:hypothetical protein